MLKGKFEFDIFRVMEIKFAISATAALLVFALLITTSCSNSGPTDLGTNTVATVTVESIDNITANGTNVNSRAEIESGASPITERGVCWSLNINPTTENDCNQEGSGDGKFTTTISGLNSETQYYVRSYAINNAGTAYSNEEIFTTEEGLTLATVTTDEISSITSNSAQTGGVVTDDGGADVTARGVCLNTSQSPTLNDDCTSDGSSTGSFTSSLTNLSSETTYYVRAFATNSEGTSYGIQRTFNTESGSGSGDWPRDTETEVVEVTNPTTGRIWMDRNLGASLAATSSTDEAAYGNLYQWGRAADGHQERTSPITTTPSSTDQPGHGDFIATSSSPYDWRRPQNDNLWEGGDRINNPCPDGYRLPTEFEWNLERQSWSSNDAAGAFDSPLKLPLAGVRFNSSGSLRAGGSEGKYWSSTDSGDGARRLGFTNDSAGSAGVSSNRALGHSIRCIKD